MVCPALPIDMGDSKPLNGGSYSFRQPTVKVEPVSLDSVHSLLSRLPSPSRSSSNVRHSATSPPRCKRKTSYTSPTRGDLSIMTHPYGTWSPKADQIPVQGGYASGMQSSGSNRRGGSGDEQSYRFPDSYSQQVKPYVEHFPDIMLTNYSRTRMAVEMPDILLRALRRVFLMQWAVLACPLIHQHPRQEWLGRLPQPLASQEVGLLFLARETSLLILLRPIPHSTAKAHRTHSYLISHITHHTHLTPAVL